MSKQTDTLDAIRARANENPDVLPVYEYRQDVDFLLAKIDADAKVIAESEKFRDDLDKAIDKIEDGVDRAVDTSAGVLALYEFTKTQLDNSKKLIAEGWEIVEYGLDGVNECLWCKKTRPSFPGSKLEHFGYCKGTEWLKKVKDE